MKGFKMKNKEHKKYLVVLTAMLFISLIVNIYQYKSNKNHDNLTEAVTISRMVKYIEEARTKSDILLYSYSELSDLKKVQTTSEIKNLIDRSIDFSSMSGKYFTVLKYYSGEFASLSYQISKGDNPDLETIQKLNGDLILLENFLYENDIWNISQEELFNSWNKYDDRLNTESLKGIFGQ